jgi:hypothetical protein
MFCEKRRKIHAAIHVLQTAISVVGTVLRELYDHNQHKINMGWQKTFTLSKRAKGCHLVTEEVINHIRPGLQDVQASEFP